MGVHWYTLDDMVDGGFVAGERWGRGRSWSQPTKSDEWVCILVVVEGEKRGVREKGRKGRRKDGEEERRQGGGRETEDERRQRGRKETDEDRGERMEERMEGDTEWRERATDT